MRLEMKPGESFASIGVLPSFFASSTVTVVVASEVPKPRMISISVINGTGFIKCIPITLSGRLVTPPIFVSEIEDVLEARITSGFASASRSRKIFSLRSGFSVAASMMKSACAAAESSAFVVIAANAESFAAR